MAPFVGMPVPLSLGPNTLMRPFDSFVPFLLFLLSSSLVRLRILQRLH
eukprot:XP_001708935.1 Hypothetical protein GL50803_23954 [Giardia lamblia ATCC 50803]